MAYAFTPVVTFVAAVYWRKSDQLTLAEALTSLSIVALVSAPITNLLSAIPDLTATLACFKRVEKYLLKDQRVDSRLAEAGVPRRYGQGELDLEAPASSDVVELQPFQVDTRSDGRQRGGRHVLLVRNASFGTKSDGKQLIRNINLSIKPSTTTMVIGPIGSGKSLLLKGVLGEIPCIEGSVAITNVSVAYCDQSPWLLNTSIRQNIVGQTAFLADWYQEVLHACALGQDIADQPDTDASIVGSGGINLSGGQKQRLVRSELLKPMLNTR